MGEGTILVCPRCKPPVVRHLNGARITGWLPVADFVGYLDVPPAMRAEMRALRPPTTCPNCQTPLERRG